jgi:transposase
VSKYCDHLPLYRQEQIFAQRHNVNLPRQTLARWSNSVPIGCGQFTNRSAPA